MSTRTTCHPLGAYLDAVLGRVQDDDEDDTGWQARGSRAFGWSVLCWANEARGPRVDVALLVRALAKKRIVPRIENAERFASESLVLLLRHDPTGVEFDVSMAWTDFEHAAIAASSVAVFGVVKAPMARPEDRSTGARS